MWDSYDDFQPYVSAAQRRADSQKKLKKLRKQGYQLNPLEAFSGNKIAKSFWGHAWCRHLESFSDYENRLPRGRSYVRNGSVCHLEIKPGEVEAMVCGSEIYEVRIKIDSLPASKWSALKRQCSGKIGTLIDLLQGKLSDETMRIVTDRDDGLFPTPQEIRLDCNCPDYADLCKHLAAVLYGVGARLDEQPELLFRLRRVDQNDLVEADLTKVQSSGNSSKRRRLALADIGDVFGVELDKATTEKPEPASPAKPAPTRAASGPTSKKTPAKIPKPSKAKKEPIPPPSPTTGAAVRKLRRKFGMTEWEFGFMMDVSDTTIRNWEAKGRSPHNARPKNQQELDTVVRLTVEEAWDRLNEYL